MGWVLDGAFDWPAWKQSAEAMRPRDDAEYLAGATTVQLAHLLTVLIRQDRYADGALAASVESGLLPNILRRAAALEAD